MKLSITISAFILFIFSTVSCSDTYDPPTPDYASTTIDIFSATFLPVAGTESKAFGNAKLLFNESSKKFIVVVNISGLTAVAGHIHAANGAIVFDLSPNVSPLASPTTYSSPELTASQISELLADHYYINLHSAKFPNGEISGVLKKSGTIGNGTGSSDY